jgi:hypothetical protein
MDGTLMDGTLSDGTLVGGTLSRFLASLVRGAPESLGFSVFRLGAHVHYKRRFDMPPPPAGPAPVDGLMTASTHARPRRPPVVL